MDPKAARRLAGVLIDQAKGQLEFEIDLLDDVATRALKAALEERGCTVEQDSFRTVLTVRLPI